MNKFDSVNYIDEITNIDELKKEFKYLWEDYYDLNKEYSILVVKYEQIKDALKFYADGKTYNGEYIDCGKDGIHTSTPIIYTDQGNKAKQALYK